MCGGGGGAVVREQERLETDTHSDRYSVIETELKGLELGDKDLY